MMIATGLNTQRLQELANCPDDMTPERCEKIRHKIERLSQRLNAVACRKDHNSGSARIPGITLDLPRCKSRGLGDSVAKFTEATGIAKVVKAVSKATGIPCGCGKRQEALNRLVPYQ